MLRKKFIPLFSAIFLLFTITTAYAQKKIEGRIIDEQKLPLPGVSVNLGGLKNGTVSDQNGKFVLFLDSLPGKTLSFSALGYLNQDIPAVHFTRGTQIIVLKSSSVQMDEVVVTGVFDKRKRMESSVAITTLDKKQLDAMVPNSAADLLKNVPGVYVNSSLGEVKNVVYSRGVSANSVRTIADAPNGYYYVSLQEDGLPVTGISSGVLSPDLFYRTDITLNRLEAVRGGTSSITSANAPGGIFNYLSKTGAPVFNAEIRTRLGLEGNGTNPYYRTDLNMGGPIAKSKWSYNTGGFYRYANGPRYSGYPFNWGGQIKANINRSYQGGSISFYAKYLNDHNGNALPLLGEGYGKAKLAPGVKNTDSYLLPDITVQVPNGSENSLTSFNTSNLYHSKDATLGAKWQHTLASGISISNNVKYSRKYLRSNTNDASIAAYLDNPTTYFVLGTIGPAPSINKPGTITFRDRNTGEILAEVLQSFGPTGVKHTVLSNSLNSAIENGILYQGSAMKEAHESDLIEQAILNKSLKHGSINAGLYYANSSVNINPNMPASFLSVSRIQSRPDPMDVSFTSLDGQNYQITDANGYAKRGGSFGFNTCKLNQHQIALFIGNNLTFFDHLNFDWGVRYEKNIVRGTNNVSNQNTKTGGIDGSVYTTYDNFYSVTGNNFDYRKSLNSLSFSAGLNYKIDNTQAVYARFSEGHKSPDADFYFGYTTEDAVENTQPVNQKIQQLEFGYKFKSKKLDLFVTPFYSKLSNVSTNSTSVDENNRFYTLPVLFNSVETKGVELEANIAVINKLFLRAALTAQNAKYTKLTTWYAGENGKADDKIMDYTGNKAENNPNLMFTITPSYTFGKLYAFAQWKYMGKRPANQPNAFDLPGFHQIDCGLSLAVRQKLQVSLNVNNVANGLGLMGWAAPGTISEAFNPQNFSKEKVQQNPNAIHSVIPIQPRAFFLTTAYKF